MKEAMKITLGNALAIGALIFAAGGWYVSSQRQAEATSQVWHECTRIERYLSSKDVNYWEIVREQDDDPAPKKVMK